MDSLQEFVKKKIANQLRRDSLIFSSYAKSGHPTICMSSAELAGYYKISNLIGIVNKLDQFVIMRTFF